MLVSNGKRHNPRLPIVKNKLLIMKSFFTALAFLTSFSSFAQHYYKDIIGTMGTADMIKSYQAARVNRVTLTSFDENNTRNDDFFVEQEFSPASQTLRTTTRSGVEHSSTLVSLIDEKGKVIKTIDSSTFLVSTTTYGYNGEGQLLSVSSTSVDSSKKTNESEQHLWQYANGKPSRMLRIKNRIDTTYVDFRLDEKGNSFAGDLR